MSFSEFVTVCWNFILAVSIWDVLDIAIIAYLIFRILSFARKFGSSNVIKGIMLLIAVMWLSNLLHLSVVSYLLGQTFQLGFLALIVLFQPELRALLDKVGSSRLSGIFAKQITEKEMDYTIAQTVLACTELSKAHIGMLLVFEREINLDAYIKTGSLIDAEPAAELLKNIFYPKTPLHDGAVIIKNGRIAAAACMLPLSNNTHLSRELGMRHRAGVGMSERSDAVVVIVSEETGSIAVAVDGMLKRHLTVQTFEMLLRNELIKNTEEKPKRRKVKTKRNSGDMYDR